MTRHSASAPATPETHDSPRDAEPRTESVSADAAPPEATDAGASADAADDARSPAGAVDSGAVDSGERAPAKPVQSEMTAAEPPASQPDDSWAADCEESHTFRVHGSETPDDPSNYSVAAGAEEIKQFYFDTPWDGEVQITKSRTIGNNPKVVHHWVLYSVQRGILRNGAILGKTDVLELLSVTSTQLIFVGGVGSSALVLPPDVGLRVPSAPDRGFLLEVHYYSVSAEVEEDTTRVDVCVTHTPRANVAAVHYAGRDSFTLPAHARTDVQATCRPVTHTQPVHLMVVSPHMHFNGSHAKLVLQRGSGERLTLIDTPFATKEQRSYRLPRDESAPDVIMHPGDSLETTCTYENPGDTIVRSGLDALEEMCVMVLWAWPTGELQNGLLLGTKFGLVEDADCMEP